MLVTSIFSFSVLISAVSEVSSIITITIKLLSANVFNLDNYQYTLLLFVREFTITCFKKTVFENIVEKGKKNASNQHFLPFQHFFVSY